MQREIKFRAWDKDKKQMWPVSAMHSNGAVHVDIPRQINSTMLSKEEFELMQFTGLKDKNGKEIYEGDIVRIKGTTRRKDVDGETGEILWYNAHGRWAIKLKSGVTAYYPFEKEIIGNIYENPELIKQHGT